MMRRTVLLSLVGAVAIAAGVAASVGGPSRTQAANPDAEIHVVLISNSVCLAFGGALPVPCFDLWRPGSQQRLADIVTKGLPEDVPRNCPAKDPPSAPGKLEGASPNTDVCRLLPSDFAALENLTAAQLHSEDPANTSSGLGPFQGLYVMAFLPDDSPVEFQTTKGKFIPTVDGPTLTGAPTQRFVCNGQFDDCNNDNKALKSVVVVPLGGYGADLGPGRVTVSQGLKSAAADFTVVGEPKTIKIETFKSTITNGIADIEGTIDGSPPDRKLTGTHECPLPTTLEGFTAALGRPDKTVLIGRIYDSTGQQITQGWVFWSGTNVSDADPIGDIAQFGAPITPTVNLGSFGFGAPQVLCGTKGTGLVTARATITKFATGLTTGLPVDTNAGYDTNTLDFNVIGQVGAVTAVSDPPVIDCNGTNTAKVSATVLTADGQPIANGQSVQFDVQALGIANPIVAKTGGGNGVASTTVTPLSPVGELRGVTVNITTIPSNTTAKPFSTSVRVDCSGAAPAPAAGAAAGDAAGAGAAAGAAKPAPIGIRGPDTGSGPAGAAGGLSWWPALALAAGAIALLGARFASKRD